MASRAISVSEVIDQQPLSAVQIWTIALCAVVLTMDGYHAVSMGFVTAPVAAATHIPVASFGPILSISLIGLMIAALGTGPIADRVGRKWLVIGSEIAFGVFSILNGRAHTYNEFLAYRFLTGLGLGGAMPNVVALASEYSPRRLLPAVVSILFVGMPLGGTICGVVAREVIGAYGWQWVFYIGGAVPLAIAVLLIVFLPESAPFLAARKKDPERIAKILRRIAPAADLTQVDFSKTSDETARKGVPVKHLFTEGRALGTILLWIPNFMKLLLIYFVNSWMPTLLKEAGMTTSQGVIVTSAFNFGGIFACFLEGPLIEFGGSFSMLLIEFLLTGGAMVGIALLTRSFVLAIVVAAVSGFLIIGTQAGLNALAAKFYPTPIRSTGVGWALGVGRVGSIVGPMLGGMMLGAGWKPREIIISSAVCGLLGCLAILASKFSRGVTSPYDDDTQLNAPNAVHVAH
ncbi:MAG: MFS transporter [Acidobacteriota bacterium]|nr:MFS transporter [Acidobacteriota bacterium]